MMFLGLAIFLEIAALSEQSRLPPSAIVAAGSGLGCERGYVKRRRSRGLHPTRCRVGDIVVRWIPLL